MTKRERIETKGTKGTTGRSADDREKRGQQREKNNEKNVMLDFVLVSLVFFVSLFVIARAVRLVAISSKAR